MYESSLLTNIINDGGFDKEFKILYPAESAQDCQKRYIKAIKNFCNLYGERSVIMVSAPGRTEIIGNHTDHQNGCVLAAAVDLDILCIASANNTNIVRFKSEGYELFELDLSDKNPKSEENGTSAALVRGIAAWFAENGYETGGFDAYAVSDVLSGSGLSSSAAFEVAVGNVFAALYNAPVTPVDIAKAGQYAENRYLGKPSGLMDQTACSVGSFVFIDFKDTLNPIVKSIPFNLSEHSMCLCIVDTKGSHADLNADYAAIPAEMRAVAELFGKKLLREVDEKEFYSNLKLVREKAGDRALLRAMHFFEENKRVFAAVNAVKNGDINLFLSLLNKSGESSQTCLQNISTTKEPDNQELAVALAVSKRVLSGKSSVRVHGGGFAGTIQAFVPLSELDAYKSSMAALFGEDAIHVQSIRSIGGFVYGRN